MAEMAHGWATITKAERQADGSVMVTGLMSDAGRDRDGQGMNQAWLDKAAQTWFDESGNIREQHDRFRAAGVGVNLVRKTDGGWVLQSRIVDPVAGNKCLPGPNGERPVYQGYSIGVREPRLSFEKADFPAGEVVGGYICEVSLADRPSNPRTLFTMVKADGPDQDPYPVGEESEPAPGPDTEVDTGDAELRAALLEMVKAEAPDLSKFRYKHGWIPVGAGSAEEAARKEAHAKHMADVEHQINHGEFANAAESLRHAADTAPTKERADQLVDRREAILANAGSPLHQPGKGQKRQDYGFASGQARAQGKIAEPPKYNGPVMPRNTVPVKGAGRAADALAPDKQKLAQTAREHQETQQLGRQALGEGMFAAAIKQAEAAAARRAAAAKAQVPDLVKFVSAKRRAKYAKSGVAMPNGDFPIPDQGHLESALGHLGNYQGDVAAAKAHIKKRAAALGVDVDLDGDGATEKLAALADLAKASGYLLADLIKTDGAGAPNDMDEVDAMDKAELGAMISAAVTDGLKGVEERMGEKITALSSRVEKVEAAPVPGGPAVSRAPGQTLQAKTREVAAVQERIADLDRQAHLYKSEDPQLAQGYREMADDLRAQITRS